MKDYVSIASAPTNEDCTQVGSADYYTTAKEECKRFIELIRKVCGEEPETAKLAIRSNPHDFGTYFDVVCYFDNEDEVGEDYAYFVESNSPEFWNEEPNSRKWEKSLTRNEVKEILRKVYNEREIADDLMDLYFTDKHGYYTAPRFVKEAAVIKFVDNCLEKSS